MLLFAISPLRAVDFESAAGDFEINGISAETIQNAGLTNPAVPETSSNGEKAMKMLSLISVDGTKISLDYKTEVVQENWAGQDVAAKPLVISVYNPALNAKDQIKIALKAWCKAHDGQIVSKTHKITLSNDGPGRFTGSITEGVMLYSDYAGQYYHNLVATVNGRRLRNPQDNSDSFNINFGFDPSRKTNKSAAFINCFRIIPPNAPYQTFPIRITGSLDEKKGGNLKIYAPDAIYGGIHEGETCKFERKIMPDSWPYAKFASGDSAWFFFKLSLPKTVFEQKEKHNFRAYFTVHHDEVGGAEDYDLNCNSRLE